MIVGGVAGLIFLRAPFTTIGLGLMAGSAAVGLASFAAYRWSKSNNEETDISN
jgi:hypothetical protein